MNDAITHDASGEMDDVQWLRDFVKRLKAVGASMIQGFDAVDIGRLEALADGLEGVGFTCIRLDPEAMMAPDDILADLPFAPLYAASYTYVQTTPLPATSAPYGTVVVTRDEGQSDAIAWGDYRDTMFTAWEAKHPELCPRCGGLAHPGRALGLCSGNPSRGEDRFAQVEHDGCVVVPCAEVK